MLYNTSFDKYSQKFSTEIFYFNDIFYNILFSEHSFQQIPNFDTQLRVEKEPGISEFPKPGTLIVHLQTVLTHIRDRFKVL